MEVTITTNAPLVAKQLEDLNAEIPVISRGRIFGRAQTIARRLRIYSAAPAGSKYIRTWALRDAVEVVRNDDGYTVRVDPVSDKGVHYAEYVLGGFGTMQAWMHVNRWPRMQNVVDEELAELPREIEENISAWWAGNAK